MEQVPHHEYGLSDEEVDATEFEQPPGDALTHAHDVNVARNERFTGNLALAARQDFETDTVASDAEERNQAGAKAGAVPPLGQADREPVDEAQPDRSSQRFDSDRRLLANVYADPKRHTVALLLDDITANMVMYAVRVLVADSEAHAREVRLVGATMSSDSYGAANRHAIASRYERIALRLRALERSYHDEITTA